MLGHQLQCRKCDEGVPADRAQAQLP
jgi:hypothetical protein